MGWYVKRMGESDAAGENCVSFDWASIPAWELVPGRALVKRHNTTATREPRSFQPFMSGPACDACPDFTPAGRLVVHSLASRQCVPKRRHPRSGPRTSGTTGCSPSLPSATARCGQSTTSTFNRSTRNSGRERSGACRMRSRRPSRRWILFRNSGRLPGWASSWRLDFHGHAEQWGRAESFESPW